MGTQTGIKTKNWSSEPLFANDYSQGLLLDNFSIVQTEILSKKKKET